jgi:hypothetical protein
MSWLRMLTVLAWGARIIMFEGSPLYPDVKNFLKFIDEQKYSYPQPRTSGKAHLVNQCKLELNALRLQIYRALV